MRFISCLIAFATAAGGLAWPRQAAAHVKWFEPYDVSLKPVPVAQTLSLPDFWLAAAIVVVLLVAATAAERTVPGRGLTWLLDRATALVRTQADRLLVCTIAAFFVALFARNETILTPELLTNANWVGWVQLGIAACLLARRLYPVAAAGIIGLWLYALADFDLFHMLDYLTLGLGLSGYLVLAANPDGPWFGRRFDMLRWGVATGLMWSSLEKFSYPAWFEPLLQKKPYLALGLPFATFTTMSGVAEFTLAFGLLWTPLVRRLSALALFALMLSAVFPFGRVDLIGHSTILAALLLIAAGAGVVRRPLPTLGRTLALGPAALAGALAAALISQEFLHDFIYHDDEPAWLDRTHGEAIAPGGTLPPHDHMFDNESD